MPHLLLLAGAISLALMSAVTGTGMDRCMERASFATCHHALNR
ncbi:hypothetical protein [Shinella pollutisoli]|uniref:Uncharacterized protein n=1 Tax=Shinella pollutisoli TaxID=2250594 RepID=A0ABV7DJ29_9HYPH|nr:hypothetical protein [Shinella pollutisoli]